MYASTPEILVKYGLLVTKRQHISWLGTWVYGLTDCMVALDDNSILWQRSHSVKFVLMLSLPIAQGYQSIYQYIKISIHVMEKK